MRTDEKVDRSRWAAVAASSRNATIRSTAIIGYGIGRVIAVVPFFLTALFVVAGLAALALLVSAGLHGPGWLDCHVAGGDPVADLVIVTDTGSSRIVWQCQGVGS